MGEILGSFYYCSHLVLIKSYKVNLIGIPAVIKCINEWMVENISFIEHKCTKSQIYKWGLGKSNPIQSDP